MEIWKVLLAGLVGYGLGSIPFAILITYWRVGIDVRSMGSGHAGATNTMRAAGWGAGILVMFLDILKGFIAVWLAYRISSWEFVSAVAAGAVVIGHCWPVYVGFRGGMGMGSGGGAFLAIWPFGFVLAVGLGALLQLALRHSARANFFTGLFVMPLWAIFGVSPPSLVAAAVVGLVVSLRALSDWRRVYKELWWDRG